MALKAPGILAFLLSIILVLVALAARLFDAVPFITSEPMQFYVLLAAYVILLLGCTMRGL
jgi:hypothetical protein